MSSMIFFLPGVVYYFIWIQNAEGAIGQTFTKPGPHMSPLRAGKVFPIHEHGSACHSNTGNDILAGSLSHKSFGCDDPDFFCFYFICTQDTSNPAEVINMAVGEYDGQDGLVSEVFPS